ncbi:hypothetical protein ACFQVC_17995 [Streptomyces monticola]|uniref:Secreted protein n=1 Tax=Streptomyces monticola TaxID=2666263 RepID=A0ABW2JJR8_9ACTN
MSGFRCIARMPKACIAWVPRALVLLVALLCTALVTAAPTAAEPAAAPPPVSAPGEPAGTEAHCDADAATPRTAHTGRLANRRPAQARWPRTAPRAARPQLAGRPGPYSPSLTGTVVLRC